MSNLSEGFNRSGFSRFMNTPGGRIFRVFLGIGVFAVACGFRANALGVLFMAWSVLPLSAGVLDVCLISALLGGPLSGAKIRAIQAAGQDASGQ